MNISLSAEPLFHVWSFQITNTVTNTILVDIFLLTLCYFVSKNILLVPGILQNIIEMTIQVFYDLTKTISEKHVEVIFPFVMTFFFFILLANWSELIPFITAIGLYKENTFVPLFRSASSDLNTTLALTIVSLTATHVMSIKYLGLRGYLGRFFSLNLLNLYSGLLELVSEFTKIISFSFRLYGNIFVGGILLSSVTGFFAFLVPIPVMLFEVLVGTIQATIFAMLTMAFMAIMTSPAHGEETH